ncbi:MAG: ABC transporter ATP-binding protein [Desulfobacteraceae bacterium]|nr:ABC transporter ATP-binding protein [Desulfobacteraceae bacterium]MBU4054335.1 ABC transporter ATP-binding protein/permease [Pseudomonadota bacterium]
MVKENREEEKRDRRYFFHHYLAPFKTWFGITLAFSLCFTAFDTFYFAFQGYAIDELLSKGKDTGFASLAILYFAVIAVTSVFIRIQLSLLQVLVQGILHRIRVDCFDHLQKLSFSYYDHHAVGDLLTTITTNAKIYSQVIGRNIAEVVSMGTFTFAASIYLLYLNWKVALIMFATVPVSLVLVTSFRKKILGASRHVMKGHSKLTSAYNEGITGVQTIRSLARERVFIRKFDEISGEMFLYSKKSVMLRATFLPLVGVSTGTSSGLLMWFGGEEVMIGAMTIGVLVVMNTLSNYMYDRILNLVWIVGEMQSAKASKERLFQLLSTPLDIADSPEVEAKIKDNHMNSGLAMDGETNKIKELAFVNVEFYYKKEEPVLKDFCMKVFPGQTIALVGETGAGKTTVINLLCRFYEPTSGEILINGMEYRRRSLAWWQSNLGIVPQTPFLFAGTIRDNIRYGDLEAPDEKIIQAARTVNAHDFILKLEKGYETEVGEEGKQLSGGQRQLISFARAILANPQILVMDEATSSVDPETEHLIHEGLPKVLKNRISFIIAHRLSTIRRADRILLIEDGSIKEQGSHQELMSLAGEYKDLYTKQFMHYREQEILGLSTGFN